MLSKEQTYSPSTHILLNAVVLIW